MGRATVFLVGLAAVILAVRVGVASAALAGTGIGARFELGKVNTVNAVTKLVGSVAGPSVQIDNNSTNHLAATAPDLQVEPRVPPMRANSETKVSNLNADLLDGQNATDLRGLSDVRSIDVNTRAGTGTVRCDPGEVAMGVGISAG